MRCLVKMKKGVYKSLYQKKFLIFMYVAEKRKIFILFAKML